MSHLSDAQAMLDFGLKKEAHDGDIYSYIHVFESD